MNAPQLLEKTLIRLDGVRTYDGYYMALCVFHPDSRPSLKISNRGFLCFACGKRGSLGYLFSILGGKPIVRKKFIYKKSIWSKWTEMYGSILNALGFAHENLANNLDLGRYLLGRGLTIDDIISSKLGFLSGHFTFPIYTEDGRMVGGVLRASPTLQSPSKYMVSPNCEIGIYVPNWSTVLGNQEIYLSFGILDAWTLYKAGYPAVSTLYGKTLSLDNLDRFRVPIYIIPDKMEYKDGHRLQSALGWRGRMLNINYPEGTKDLNDVAMSSNGLNQVRALIEEEKHRYDQ